MKKLSLIICKYDQNNFARCLKNIENTQTVDHELIIVDNTTNEYDIFTAYNRGIEKSTGSILCFMHEDIEYFEKGWMDNVLSHFEKDPQVGMLGVAGGASFTIFPQFWGQTYFVHDSAICLAGSMNQDASVKRQGFIGETKQALVVDGLWFCVRKALLDEHHIRFDDQTYKGFHRYDYDLSFQVAQQAKVLVVQDVPIVHYSSGSRKKEWLQATLDFNNKWKDLLPCRVVNGKVGIEKLEKSNMDVVALSSIILKMKELKCDRGQIIQVIHENIFVRGPQIDTINAIKLKLIRSYPYIPYMILRRSIDMIDSATTFVRSTLNGIKNVKSR